MTTFKQQLIDLNTCSDAVEWVGRKSLKTAWAECERAGWMLWLAGRGDVERKLLVWVACDCAETALKFVSEGEYRPADAIKVARAWCVGNATLTAVKATRKAVAAVFAADATDADDAAAVFAADADATEAAFAAFAAFAAVHIVSADTTFAAVAYAAGAADAAANAHTDGAAVGAQHAELVRKRIPFAMIAAALGKIHNTLLEEAP